MATPLTDAEFQAKVLKASTPVFVDFWAPWCGPCKVMLPIVEELSKEYEGKIAFYKMNVDENNETPAQYNVMSIPTFLIFKNGEVKDSFIGTKPKEDLASRLNAVLP